jgi:hypothetical protein
MGLKEIEVQINEHERWMMVGMLRTFMLRLDVGIGDGGIELDPIPNQPGFGNRIQYQIQFNSEQIRGWRVGIGEWRRV